MSNLKRPFVLGLSTCALLLLSAHGFKRISAANARDTKPAKPGDDSRPDKSNVDEAGGTELEETA
jgi:hypothetical protein